MSAASSRPPRRRKSALASEHPAYPAPTPVPDKPAPEPGEQQAEQQFTESSREDTRTRVREQTSTAAGEDQVPRRRRSTPDEARARKYARDAAFGWASAMRKADTRAGEWAQQMERAREAGTLPGVLREYITEATERVGCDPAEVPSEVWHAAGLDRE